MAKCWRQVSMSQAANGGVLLTEMQAWLGMNGLPAREHAEWIDTIRLIEDHIAAARCGDEEDQ